MIHLMVTHHFLFLTLGDDGGVDPLEVAGLQEEAEVRAPHDTFALVYITHHQNAKRIA